MNANISAATPRTASSTRLALLSALVVAAVTLAVTLLLTELVLRRFWKEPYMFERRLMFFSEGHNFQNRSWGGFAYEPHTAVHTVTYYVTELKPQTLVKEYEYNFASNGLGRVQHKEIDPRKPSILFLGDSFTEGQGAEPWFYSLESAWPDTSPYQLINGAILGTGIEDWGRLYDDISQGNNIQKIVVIYIGDDWHRAVWQFPAQTLACLHTSSQCIGDENFYGLPADSATANTFVQRIANYRATQLRHVADTTPLLKQSATYTHLWLPLKQKAKRVLGRSTIEGPSLASDGELQQLEVSKRTIMQLAQAVGHDNLLFIYLPQRHELQPGPNFFSKSANDFVLANKFRFVDGRAECGLAAADYHPHDGHPNAAGYRKIEACVERATRAAFPANVSAAHQGE